MVLQIYNMATEPLRCISISILKVIKYLYYYYYLLVYYGFFWFPERYCMLSTKLQQDRQINGWSRSLKSCYRLGIFAVTGGFTLVLPSIMSDSNIETNVNYTGFKCDKRLFLLSHKIMAHCMSLPNVWDLERVSNLLIFF